jgi:hypothetical protein
VFSNEDVTSFCFERGVKLSEVESRISFLLKEEDKVMLRFKDQCLDIQASSNRLGLVSKLINKNYHVIGSIDSNSSSESDILDGDIGSRQCRIELKEIKNATLNKEVLKVGSTTKASIESMNKSGSVITQLLLTSGLQGRIDLSGQELKVICVKKANGKFQLTFSKDENGKNVLSTSVDLNVGEILNVGNIQKELNEKQKTLGIPTSGIENVIGQENIKYELKIY